MLKVSKYLFTRREGEILKMIVEGKNSNQIAELLFISLHTVNVHRKNILKKAEVTNALNLVRRAIQEGWV